MDLFGGVSIWLMWFIMAAALFVAEFTLSGFVAVFIAFGASAAGMGALAGLSLPYQAGFMAVVSVLGIIFGRQFLISSFDVNRDILRTNVDAMVGREAIVTEEIIGSQTGAIHCRGERWTAASVNAITLHKGEPVIIREIRGVTAYVERKRISLQK
ncbi:NfeD family protein [Aneurinibacillus sp. Ricciae_BoGa-3]|uniref:NfeD family protein n=1 Tax=Aneurinibacillus sp. Ricciae_BoGa-3 TaxID=3022697 RepID=UPI00234272C0|nr:NfeD family protein [Aneurinibacillus sp. Ricciae_BoGa-3]WCK52715.1 NfeD family protein [Aneurinibacillus sp. Ricciae_BoGa-3]